MIKINKLKYYFLGIASGVLAFILLDNAIGAFSGRPFGTNGSVNPDISADQKIAEIYSILDNNFIWDYDKEQMSESMYYGLLAGVDDPYTRYLGNAESLKSFQMETSGHYAGIGVTVIVDENDNRVRVDAVRENSPSAKVGILPGDKIVKVKDFDVTGDSLDEAISMIRGEPGTKVTISIYRESDNSLFDVEVERALIELETVTHKMLDNQIGYLRIWEFDGVTADQYEKAFADLQSQGMKGLVLDLRNNPGGLLHIVVQIADAIVPEGTVMYQEYKDGSKSYEKSKSDHIEVPLVVLINGQSASASEVLAGAIRDHEVGQLVGMTSFGKGIVQTTFPLSDGSAINATISKYYTPNGVSIHGIGIAPDYEVEMDLETSMKISSLTLEEDNQLSKAIEVITEEMNK